jgi:methionyl aminopeptidase
VPRVLYIISCYLATAVFQTEAVCDGEKTAAAKKKKKNKKKEKSGGENGEAADGSEAVGGEEDGVATENGPTVAAKKKSKPAAKKAKAGKQQTDPPSIPVSELFPGGQFPEGQILEHPIAANDQKAKVKRRRFRTTAVL